MDPDKTTSASSIRKIDVFSMNGFDNKVAPGEKDERNGSAGKIDSPVPYAPFSTNGQKTIYNSGIKQDYAWNYKDPKQLQDDKKIPIKYLWSGATGVIFALVNSCFIFCAFPQNHIFLVPKAWHEFMTTAAIGFTGLFAASLILNCEIWMNVKGIKTWKNFIMLYLITAFAWILGNIGYYHVYVILLDLSPPMPLNIHVVAIFTYVMVMSVFWMLIPSEVRAEETFWKRYGYYILAQVMRYAAIMEYFFITLLFVFLSKDYQWGIAFILPIIREINGYVLGKICYKSAGVENNAIKLTTMHEMTCRHAVYLSVALSLLATEGTAYFCLGLDFAVNLFICLKIIWREKKQEETLDIEDDVDLQELALNEKVVYVVPLAYCVCATVAYWGPNAWIIGNIYNQSWHFERVEDFSQPVKIMAILFAIDIISIVLWYILLRVFCRISFYNAFMYIQQQFWLFMAIHEAFSLNEVSINQRLICTLSQPIVPFLLLKLSFKLQ